MSTGGGGGIVPASAVTGRDAADELVGGGGEIVPASAVTGRDAADILIEEDPLFGVLLRVLRFGAAFLLTPFSAERLIVAAEAGAAVGPGVTGAGTTGVAG